MQLTCTHQTELSEWFQKNVTTNTVSAEKMKFSIKIFLRDLRIWSYLLKKPLIKNFIFCAVSLPVTSALTVQRDSIATLSVRPCCLYRHLAMDICLKVFRFANRAKLERVLHYFSIRKKGPTTVFSLKTYLLLT